MKRDMLERLTSECFPMRKAPTQKQKAIECIKALSKIEGYTMSYEENMKRTDVLYDNIGTIMNYFEELLEELDR